ncbi:AMP-dependent synthetase/ligase [Photobacterium profundum]|uniref:Long-chain-fatty-acid-CoAligase n=1 Tax=Photobacterium profundum (strain SS9) TaxID=298386 RepID=Q6LV19_PHOPR|nr:long-chain fatty acid--CoA ligase [Photobacterium profundum]CAG18856.1 putative long-chain-fatty-acid-CoAligase [Photobacterium profundum SS9]
MAENDFHIVNRIRTQIARLGDKVALRHQAQEQWQDITWNEFGEQIQQLAIAMLAHGMNVQDKVAIFSNNMPRWTVTDFAALYNRCVTVPIYSTNTPQQAAYVLNDADVRLLFVGEQVQLDAAIGIAEGCPKLERIVTLSDDLVLPDNPLVCSFNDFLCAATPELEAELQQRLNDTAMDDLLTLIYTSGTTGTPKGVMLDYANIAAQLAGHDQNLSLDEGDSSLCFLPLSHVFERAWTFYVLHRGAINHYLTDTNQLKEALADVKPNVMAAVPRVYEKIYSTVHDKVSRAPFHRKLIFTWAVNMGARMAVCHQEHRQPSKLLTMSHNLANKLVLSKLRDILGGNIKFMPCGGAKLDEGIGRFFHAIGINVKLGYGMTETTATVSCWDDQCFNPDSIGMAMPGAEIKIGENNEILVRGPMVMRGYYNMPEETAKNFTEDGFLKTGDAGHFDEQGNLFITDRIKELMKTSGGKYIAPQVIEGAIGKDHFIEQIAVIADTRKFVSALIVPCFDTLEEHARELNIKYKDRLELVKNSQIVELIEKRVVELQKDLARFEQVKKITLLPKAFSMDKGELTPTQKLRRKVIHDRYHQEIERMYEESHRKANK